MTSYVSSIESVRLNVYARGRITSVDIRDLLLQLALFGPSADTPPSHAGPYEDPRTSYFDDYLDLLRQHGAQDTAGDASIGGGGQAGIDGAGIVQPTGWDANWDVPSFGGKPQNGGWTSERANPTSGGIAGLDNPANGAPSTGYRAPIHFEDGSTIPGELSPILAAQLVSGPFQQFSVGKPRDIAPALSALQSGLTQSQASPNRGIAPIDLRTSMGYGYPLLDLARGFDQMTRGEFYPDPDMGPGGPFHASPATQGLFGNSQAPAPNAFIDRLQQARKLF